MTNQLTCKIVSIIDPYKLVLNVGTNENVKIGMKFSVFSISEDDIIDPTTQESLGKLEIPKGTGNVIHVQNKMCIIESNQYKQSINRIITKKEKPPVAISSFFEPTTVTEEIPQEKYQIPFDDVSVGDTAIYIP